MDDKLLLRDKSGMDIKSPLHAKGRHTKKKLLDQKSSVIAKDEIIFDHLEKITDNEADADGTSYDINTR